MIERIFMLIVLEKMEEQGLTKTALAERAFSKDRGKPNDKMSKLIKEYKPQKPTIQDAHNLAAALHQSLPSLIFETYEAHRTGKFKEQLKKYGIDNPPQKKTSAA